MDDGDEIDTLRTNVVNYLEKPCSDTVTKCDKIDKLHALWQESVATFPEESVKLYVNDQSPPSFCVNHYESPIKLRNTSVTSNSENDLATPTNERSQSYIDMEGKKSSEVETETETEVEELLVFANRNENNDEARSNWRSETRENQRVKYRWSRSLRRQIASFLRSRGVSSSVRRVCHYETNGNAIVETIECNKHLRYCAFFFFLSGIRVAYKNTKRWTLQR